MTLEERERAAYAAGNTELAEVLGELGRVMQLLEDQDSEAQTDLAGVKDQLAECQSELEELKARHEALRDAIAAALDEDV